MPIYRGPAQTLAEALKLAAGDAEYPWRDEQRKLLNAAYKELRRSAECPFRVRRGKNAPDLFIIEVPRMDETLYAYSGRYGWEITQYLPLVIYD